MEESPQDQADLVGDIRVKSLAHSDDGLGSEIQDLSVKRQSHEIVKRAGYQGKNKSGDAHGGNGTLHGPVVLIDAACGKDKDTSGQKVGHLADSRRSRDGKVYKVLEKLDGHAVPGAEREGSDQNGDLREIELKERRHKGKRYLKVHENDCKGRHYCAACQFKGYGYISLFGLVRRILGHKKNISFHPDFNRRPRSHTGSVPH